MGSHKQTHDYAAKERNNFLTYYYFQVEKSFVLNTPFKKLDDEKILVFVVCQQFIYSLSSNKMFSFE